DELLEIEPRSIRQLWTNPMREDGRWALILEQTGAPRRVGEAQRTADQRGNQGGAQTIGLDTEFNRDSEASGPPVLLSGGEVGSVPVGSRIIGVYNPDSPEKTFRVFFDSNEASEWRFTVSIFQAANVGLNQQIPGSGGPMARPLNAADVGRPFPPGVAPPAGVPNPAANGGGPTGPDGRPTGAAPPPAGQIPITGGRPIGG
ncbi:MAG: hypothetical protein AAF772_00785, partial [Acidobacteriota bacterium]